MMLNSNLAEDLRKQGITVVELPDWASFSADSRKFVPVGVMNHHTATRPTLDDNRLAAIIRQHKYYNILVGRSGVVYLIGAGRMWHAGSGNKAVLKRTKASEPPTGDAKTHGFVNGNTHYYGVAISNSGTAYTDGTQTEPVPAVQWQSLIAVNALILTQMKSTTAAVAIHHREWTSRKVDILAAAGDLRTDVQNALVKPSQQFQLTDGVFAIPNPLGGFYYVQEDGGVFGMEGAVYQGSLPELGVIPEAPIISGMVTSSGAGYWLLAADGGVFAFGDAPYLGSLKGKLDELRGQPVALDRVDGSVVIYGDKLTFGSTRAPQYILGES